MRKSLELLPFVDIEKKNIKVSRQMKMPMTFYK